MGNCVQLISKNDKGFLSLNEIKDFISKNKATGIFSEETKSFDALLNLFYTNVGFNTYLDPWNEFMLEIDP